MTVEIVFVGRGGPRAQRHLGVELSAHAALFVVIESRERKAATASPAAAFPECI